MWSAIQGLISGGASLIGGMMTNKTNSANNLATNQANYMMAMQNQAWQQQMRATQYQTAVKDMKAAGLNPAMMYGGGGAGGAGTPNVSSPTMQTAHAENTVGPAVDRALSALRFGNETDLAKASVANTVQQTATSAKQAELTASQTEGQNLTNLSLIPEAAARIAAATGSAKSSEAAAKTAAAALPGVAATAAKLGMTTRDYQLYGPKGDIPATVERSAKTALDLAQKTKQAVSAAEANRMYNDLMRNNRVGRFVPMSQW